MATIGKGQDSTIETNGIELESARCERCGAKIYPASELKRHLERHVRRDNEYRKVLREVHRKGAGDGFNVIVVESVGLPLNARHLAE